MKKSICILITLLIAFPALSQDEDPDLEVASSLGIGIAQYTILFAMAFTDYFDEDLEVGPNQVYDHSDLEEQGLVEVSFQDPESANGSENFEDATHAKRTHVGSFSQVVEFLDVDDLIIENLGNWNNTTGDEQVKFCSDPNTLYIFPIEYQSTWKDSYSCEKQPPFVGFQSDDTGNYQAECDGFGTLILPIGEYEDVLRIKFTEEGKNTSFFDGSELSVLNFSRTTYHWLKAGYPVPLCTFTRTIFSGDPSEVQGGGVTEWTYMATDPLSDNYLEQVLNVTRIYPNPANSYIELSNLEGLSKVAVTYEIISPNGEIVQNGSLDHSLNQARLDISQLRSGFYALKLHTENASVTKKLIVN